MTQDECIKQAIGRVNRYFPKTGGIQGLEFLMKFAREALDPMTRRDQVIDPGEATAEKWNPETHKSETVAVKLHPARPVAPYVYGPQDVLWLEREIRRRAGL